MSTTGLNLGMTVSVDQTLGQARSAQALHALQNSSAGGSTKKIDKAAHDFESILLGEWLEQAEKSFATVPGSDPDQNSDPGHDQMQSLACEFMGSAISKAGGIGLSAMISKHLKAVEAARTATEAAKHEGNQGNPAGSAKPETAGSQVIDTKGR